MTEACMWLRGPELRDNPAQQKSETFSVSYFPTYPQKGGQLLGNWVQSIGLRAGIFEKQKEKTYIIF